jgi:hypothetical protein
MNQDRELELNSFLPEDPAAVDVLAHDAKLLAAGGIFHYIIDPFDILNFCFPLYRAQKLTLSHSSMINSAVALFEVFYNNTCRPILLDEYRYELVESAWNLENEMKEQQNRLRSVELGENVDVGRRFVEILAVALGMFNEGLSRLTDVCTDRLLDRPEGNSVDGVVLQEIFDSTRPSSSAAQLALALYKEIVADIESRSRKPLAVGRKEGLRRGSLRDAYAIDRLLSIIRAVNERTAELESKHCFFYVSSAERTKALIEIVRRDFSLGKGDLDPYVVWRTPKQILLSMTLSSESADEAQDELSTLRKIVEVRQDLIKMPGRADLLEEYNKLQKYRGKISLHYEKSKNYGLVSLFSQAGAYSRLVEEASEGRDAKRAMEILIGVLRDPEYAIEAHQQRKENLFFTKTKGSFADSIVQGMARREIRYSGDWHAPKPGQDAVGSSVQRFPTMFRISLSQSGFGSLLEDILSYFLTPVHGRRGRRELIQDICRRFLDLDTDTENRSEEHEFIRCLLFLAMPTVDADKFAFDHAKDMVEVLAEKVKSLESGRERDRLRAFEVEFRCLACWAARRWRFYRRGEEWATSSIAKYKENPDPRFFHARCLNTFSWFDEVRRGESDVRPPSGDVTIARALEDGKRGIDLYEEWGERARDQVGALHNTIACLYVYELDGYVYDVPEARLHLEILKRTIEKLSWYDRYPEYFHTEAFVEYHEFKALRLQGSSVRALIDKLENALREIKLADAMYREGHMELEKHYRIIVGLQDQIEHELRQLSAEG